MELKDTIELMTSADYKDRFKAEYHQLYTRYIKLLDMVEKWSILSFTPTCPKSTYELQLRAMKDYLTVLELRAVMEGIDLSEK